MQTRETGEPGFWRYIEEHLPRMGYHDSRTPAQLDRAAYERRARAAGVAVVADEEILRRTWYLTGGAELPNSRTAEAAAWYVGHHLAARRLRGLLVERGRHEFADTAEGRVFRPVPTAPADAPRRPEETAACVRCGGTYPRSQMMHASLGLSCPECYDAASDRSA